MATLTVTALDRAGINTGTGYAAAASGGDVCPNDDGRTFLHVKNGHASATRTVTITPPASTRTLAEGVFTVPTIAVVVAALGEQMIGPFERRLYNNASGQLAISYSDAAADVTLRAFRLNPARG